MPRVASADTAVARSTIRSAIIPSHPLDRHRGRFTATDTECGDAALPSLLPEGANQRDEDPRTRRTDRMAQRTGATVHVDELVPDPVLLHCRHGHDGERLVDLEKVDLLRRPTRLRIPLLDGADGCRGEALG